MNEVANIPQPQLQPVTQQQAEAWVSLAKAKNEVIYQLQVAELSAQNILLPVANSTDYKEIDAALAAYRKVHADMVTRRRIFTGGVDKALIQSVMEFEKRVDPEVNKAYMQAVGNSLQLRRAEKEKADRLNAINEEKARFKIHIENNRLRIEQLYFSSLTRVVNEAYAQMLTARMKEPDTEKVKTILSTVARPTVEKFQPHYLTNEQMTEIYNDCQKPDYNKIMEDALFIMKTKFSNWESDLANASEAIQHQKEQQELQEAEAKKKMEEEAAINTLITTAEVVKAEEPKIKRNLIVKVDDNEVWAKAVMAAFIVHLPQMAKYLRVRSWSNLKVGQMADYLGKLATDTGETFKDLTLEEVEK